MSSTTFTKVDSLDFVEQTLISIVQLRLPLSCFIYNQLKIYHKFCGDEMEVYFSGSGIYEDDTWILTKCHREDWSCFVSISPPSKLTKESKEEMKKVLQSTGIIDWNQQLVIAGLERSVTEMVMGLLLDDEKQHKSLIFSPCCLYYMTPEEALKLDASTLGHNVRVGPLDVDAGTPFIAENFVYHNDRTAIPVRRAIQRLISGGVYIKETEREEKLVCGGITLALGLLSMLHTDANHRRKGYASLCERYMLKEYALNGLQPCLLTELTNKAALSFHNSIGLKSIARVFCVENRIQS